MQEFVLVPYVGVGHLRFGDTRQELESKLGTPAELFRRDINEPTLTMSYPNHELFVELSPDNTTVLAFEFYGNSPLIVQGVELMRLPNREGIQFIKSIDNLAQNIDDESMISWEYGIVVGIAVEDLEDEDTPSVLAFSRGYWDNYSKDN